MKKCRLDPIQQPLHQVSMAIQDILQQREEVQFICEVYDTKTESILKEQKEMIKKEVLKMI